MDFVLLFWGGRLVLYRADGVIGIKAYGAWDGIFWAASCSITGGIRAGTWWSTTRMAIW